VASAIGLFALIQFVLGENGLMEFLKMERILQSRRDQLSGLVKENNSLFDEIIKIQTDESYQKKTEA
jgi:cell division protein FtsB